MAVVLNAFLVWVYWTYLPVVLAQEEEPADVQITFFEDFSGEIINGTKHFGFQWSPSEEGNETLVFENGKILFSNGTVLLS